MAIELLNIDCMEYMRGLPDKAFDLAISLVMQVTDAGLRFIFATSVADRFGQQLRQTECGLYE